MRPSVEIALTADERGELERLARGRKVWRGLRAQIVLLAASGLTNVEIAKAMDVTDQTARKWRNRFAEHRLDGLDDEPRSGRPRRIDDAAVAEVVRKTLEEKPRDATHWSTRSMAQATGYAPSTINRIWRAFCLQPQRDLQAVERPVLRRQDTRHRRAVRGPAAARHGALRGRKVAGSGSRPHPAVVAIASRRAAHP